MGAFEIKLIVMVAAVSVLFSVSISSTFAQLDEEGEELERICQCTFDADCGSDETAWCVWDSGCVNDPLEIDNGICGEFGEPGYIPSPKKQVRDMGIPPDSVKCKEGLELIFKNTNKSPVCVKPLTKKILLDREWAILSLLKQ